MERCSFKGKVLMILTIFKILKIHYKHFWLEFLNKYTLVYSEICFNKNLYQTETIFAKQINWQLTGFYMIQFFFLKSTSEQTLVLSKTLLNLLWNLPNVSLNWNSISSSFFVYILKNPKQIYYSLKTYWLLL